MHTRTHFRTHTQGHLTSYNGVGLEKYTAAQAHGSALSDIVVNDTSVLTIGGDSELRVASRLGMQKSRIQ
jgi:hypothetical protein